MGGCPTAPPSPPLLPLRPRRGQRRRGRGAAAALLACAVPAAEGCSFIVCSYTLAEAGGPARLEEANRLSRLRGPDATNVKELHGWTFVHNLLHMTGERTLQPFVAPGDAAAATFNGEIYNWRELEGRLRTPGGAAWRSDGDAMLAAYARHGGQWAQQLRGEFSALLVEFRPEGAVVHLATDPFRTRPYHWAVWTHSQGGRNETRFAAASYPSALVGLGAPPGAVRPVPPNTVMALEAAKGFAERPRVPQHVFDIGRQWKNSTQDWMAAFERSVARRVSDLLHVPFIGLSAGYDSGAVAAALRKLGQRFLACTMGRENDTLIDERVRAMRTVADSFRIGEHWRGSEHGWMLSNVEPLWYPGGMRGWDDGGAQGASAIARRMRKLGGLIYLTGLGADEVVSDYSYAPRLPINPGAPGFSLTQGDWPPNLADFFPGGVPYWLAPLELQDRRQATHLPKRSCRRRRGRRGQVDCSGGYGAWGAWGGNPAQPAAGPFWDRMPDEHRRASNFTGWPLLFYLMNTDYTGGAHGIEARHPFLDVEVVQEFLWLTAEVKRSEYKRPIADYLRATGFPFALNGPGKSKKQGFQLTDERDPRGKAAIEALNRVGTRHGALDDVRAGWRRARAQGVPPCQEDRAVRSYPVAGPTFCQRLCEVAPAGECAVAAFAALGRCWLHREPCSAADPDGAVYERAPGATAAAPQGRISAPARPPPPPPPRAAPNPAGSAAGGAPAPAPAGAGAGAALSPEVQKVTDALRRRAVRKRGHTALTSPALWAVPVFSALLLTWALCRRALLKTR